MRKSLPRRIAVSVTALVLLPVSVLLSACDPDQVGTAAIINGDPIRVGQLQAATQSFLEVVPSYDKKAAQQQILNNMILREVTEEAARRADVSATPAEASAVLDEVFRQYGGRNELVRAAAGGQEPRAFAPTQLRHTAREIVLQNKLATKLAGGRNLQSPEVAEAFNAALEAAASSLKVEVNPRYGTWDAKRRGVLPLVSGGLSKSRAELARADERT